MLSNCPWKNMASSVVSPLLIPEAIDLLRHSLNYDEQLTWKSLGIAWSLTRAEYPEGHSIPPYTPTFTDGWVLPSTWRANDLDKAPNGIRNSFLDRPSNLPQVVQATCDFHARNPRELAVRKGDLLEILDQRKKWWLARNMSGQQGHIPNNILEPVDQKVSNDFPDLHPGSTPAEVTVWLRTKGFSKITVKTLGGLNGRQLLSMTQQELKMVCPEEGRKVFSMFSEVNQHW